MAEVANIDYDYEILEVVDEKARESSRIANEKAAEAQAAAEAAQSTADTATNIAKGRNQAHVFNTTAEMQTWLSNAANKGLWSKGDNIYIVELDVPDWWVAEVLTTADPDTGYYYKIAQLETQKVDLTPILAELDTKVTNSFTGERALIAGTNGMVTTSGTTSTELYMLHGVTSNVQTQLNNRPTIGSEPDFHGVHLSSSKTAYVYSSDDNVNFVYKTSAGGTGYSSVRALAEDKLPKAGGTVTGKLTTQQVENSTGYAVGANSNSYSTAPFVASAPYSTNTGSRAGYGFHNHGNNGTFLYLQTDGTLHHVNNSGQDRKIMDSSNFSYDASTQTLNITL